MRFLRLLCYIAAVAAVAIQVQRRSMLGRVLTSPRIRVEVEGSTNAPVMAESTPNAELAEAAKGGFERPSRPTGAVTESECRLWQELSRKQVELSIARGQLQFVELLLERVARGEEELLGLAADDARNVGPGIADQIAVYQATQARLRRQIENGMAECRRLEETLGTPR